MTYRLVLESVVVEDDVLLSGLAAVDVGAAGGWGGVGRSGGRHAEDVSNSLDCALYRIPSGI